MEPPSWILNWEENPDGNKKSSKEAKWYLKFSYFKIQNKINSYKTWD